MAFPSEIVATALPSGVNASTSASRHGFLGRAIVRSSRPVLESQMYRRSSRLVTIVRPSGEMAMASGALGPMVNEARPETRSKAKGYGREPTKAVLPSAETAMDLMRAPGRNREVPRRIVLPAGKGSSNASGFFAAVFGSSDFFTSTGLGGSARPRLA